MLLLLKRLRGKMLESEVRLVSLNQAMVKLTTRSGGGGFIPGIVFNPTLKGLAYARADIGGAYRLNSDDSWTPLLDSVNSSNW